MTISTWAIATLTLALLARLAQLRSRKWRQADTRRARFLAVGGTIQ